MLAVAFSWWCNRDASMNYKVNCRLYMIITAQVSLPFACDPVMYHSSTRK